MGRIYTRFFNVNVARVSNIERCVPLGLVLPYHFVDIFAYRFQDGFWNVYIRLS